MKELQFDIVIHLAGEQSVPNYMGIKLSAAREHILLTTTKTENQYEVLSRMFLENISFVRNIVVDATDYTSIKGELNAIIGLENKKVGVNVTGGTKPMFAAALDFCREHKYTPFYLDTQNRLIILLTENFCKIPMSRVFSSVEEFAKLAGYKLNGKVKYPDDISQERRELIKLFWECKDYVRQVIAEFSEATNKKYQSQKGNPPDCYLKAVNLIRRPRRGNKKEERLAEAWESVFPTNYTDWRIAAKFGAGEWFEEWLLLQFANSKKADVFCDLCSDVTLSFSSDSDNKNVQQIDVAYTDGYELTLIECKAGKVDQDHIQKLENIRRQVGGAMGKGFLCAINYQYPSDVVVERIKNGSLSLVTGEKPLRMLPNRYDMIKSRQCYQDERDFD